MLQKYSDPLSLEEWIRHPVKSIKGTSIIESFSKSLPFAQELVGMESGPRR